MTTVARSLIAEPICKIRELCVSEKSARTTPKITVRFHDGSKIVFANCQRKAYGKNTVILAQIEDWERLTPEPVNQSGEDELKRRIALERRGQEFSAMFKGWGK